MLSAYVYVQIMHVDAGIIDLATNDHVQQSVITTLAQPFTRGPGI